MREWKKIEGFDFKEIIFEEYHHIAKITINRERYRNAFTPLTTWEMSQAFSYCRESQDIRVVILTGAGDKAFCAGGDMHVKGRGGYVGNRRSATPQCARRADADTPSAQARHRHGERLCHRWRPCAPRDVRPHHRLRECHLRTDGSRRWEASTLASVPLTWHAWWDRRRPARYGSCAEQYSAREAEEMGMVNKVVPLAELEDTCVEWAEIMMERSPLALRMIKAGLECRARRTGRHPGAGRRCHHALLHHGRGAGGRQGLPREAQAPLRRLSTVPMML